MAFFPVFLSIVFVVRNQSTHAEKILSNAASCCLYFNFSIAAKKSKNNETLI
jgi:hypothetical protein